MVKWGTGLILLFSGSTVLEALVSTMLHNKRRKVDDLNFVALPKSLQGSLMSTLGKKSHVC